MSVETNLGEREIFIEAVAVRTGDLPIILNLDNQSNFSGSKVAKHLHDFGISLLEKL